MIELLSKPIVDLLGAFGSGHVPTGSPADVLRASSRTLDTVQRIGQTAVSELATTWSGPAAAAAVDLAEEAHGSATRLARHGDEMAVIIDRACEKVQAGVVELQGIVQSFTSIAVSSAPVLLTPPGQTMIIAAAVEHLQRALAVVARVRAELAVHAGEMAALASPPPVPAPPGAPPAPTVPTAVPAATGADPSNLFLRNFAQSVSVPSLPEPQTYASTSPAAAVSDSGMSTFAPQRESAAVGARGRGVEVALPDGTVAVAPNERAAGAVRSALSQQGVPYVWGGTEPGRGLDCSGLTQWAYGEQGVQLPRLAQEQDIGPQVSEDELMPGDLAVWDGHVAMVIGNGQFVEAGDPVQVSAIRTTNSGMGFQGFYRPTA
ncbi:C40 family peptidase [Rhodococcus sp. BP-252]|uniref:C40 family peptidase n=1 Tax=unclassified Rhodococcus (in: high G+C Gram-positive bacteria) TaxID=192944 RepID=UPI001C9B9844|nr:MULTISPECIES: C40 family peptidase [unclassified Rhodococcus (in: high G+C Gram-positive bacteria)]MBY6413847.1 C40 family peptidase [Rhodococcus sp. BP-320]MBY6419267.1 C40 family peptidase [Rhodococcus sp. BP-321]MBY6424082.1 C40 family peptidase [Rhodococcus sp. BP-324]MBY6428580.1 C40 family peptidase [Rhodococcus sp. BP-323]MBY6434332.1 C40 family peptidase [Rhodococcus sp. BP-322]